MELPSFDETAAPPEPEPEPEPTGGLVEAPSETASMFLEACVLAGKMKGSTSVGPFPFHTAGTFDLMQEVEVYRTNGSWSPARVVYYDEAGDTYDVELLDAPGVMKYMQEADYLRHIELINFKRHQGVQVLEERVWVWARIDNIEKDPSAGGFVPTFIVTVELIDGQLRCAPHPMGPPDLSTQEAGPSVPRGCSTGNFRGVNGAASLAQRRNQPPGKFGRTRGHVSRAMIATATQIDSASEALWLAGPCSGCGGLTLCRPRNNSSRSARPRSQLYIDRHSLFFRLLPDRYT